MSVGVYVISPGSGAKGLQRLVSLKYYNVQKLETNASIDNRVYSDVMYTLRLAKWVNLSVY